MLGFFITYPWAAFLPAIVFLVLGRVRASRRCSVAGWAWAVYAVLEVLNKLRITCSGECNIRIDLLLIYPVLGLLSVMAIIQALSGRAGPAPRG